MDTFSVIVVGGLVAIFLTFIALGRWHSRRPTDITEKKQRQALATQAGIEDRDIPQMVDAQNAYRRRRGAPETTETEVRARVGSEELQKLDTADREAKNREHHRHAQR